MEKNLTDISWSTLPWKQFRDKLFCLQVKLYRLKKQGNFKKLYSLQKLLIKSQTTHYIAIKDINDFTLKIKLNIVSLTSREKFNLSISLHKSINLWRYDSKRPLNIIDLIVLYVWKLALDPIYDDQFNFFQKPPMLKCSQIEWDLQRRILRTLNDKSPYNHKKIILIDFRNSFININYKSLLQRLHLANPYKVSLFKALQEGLLSASSIFDDYPKSEGFLLSALLKRVILQDLETIDRPPGPYFIQTPLLTIRYNYTILYILDPLYDYRILLDRIRVILKTNGGDLIDIKITITTSRIGFEFLEWYFRVTKKGQSLSYPNKLNLKKQKQKVQGILKNSNYSLESRIHRLRIVVKNWYQYNKLCDFSKIKSHFYYLKLWVFKYLKKSSSLSKEKRLFYLNQVFDKN